MMNSLTDDELKLIKRGGQDPKKVYAAFRKASETTDQPTVILIKTVKGDGMGTAAQGRNNAHQKKDLNAQERLACARAYGIPLDDDAIQRAEFYRPPDDSDEMRYLQSHRQALGGYLPQRKVDCPVLPAPALTLFQSALDGSGDRAASTTMAMVRMLAQLMKDAALGDYVVPIVPDEARTFGMDALFKVAGIYSPAGQNYTPVDAESLMSYREAVDGQIMQEGICETGAMASFMAAGTAYAVHGVPTIPFYIFYSMFGFQRVGDMIWSCADMMTRGFLLGGTAGRTTLNGEGLQHEDGHSHLLASTFPNLKSYDPAFAYELAVIVRDGIHRMYELGENIFYYITLYNENYPMPAMPEGDDIADGIIRGAYCWAPRIDAGEPVDILASGSMMQQAIAAAQRLRDMGYAPAIWSVTSYIELAREAEQCEREARLNPLLQRRQPYVESLFASCQGPVIAVSDYLKSLPASIARWMPATYTVLGTDGFGLSESREDLRNHFEVSAAHIANAAIVGLYRQGRISERDTAVQLEQLAIDVTKPDPAAR
jgi:pyruvate dehydrogenase E1 component